MQKTTEVIKNYPNEVHMARFGPIIAQNRSHGLWEASGMPPGPQNPSQKSQNPGLSGVRGSGGQGLPIPPYFPCVGKLELLLQGVVGPLLALKGP